MIIWGPNEFSIQNRHNHHHHHHLTPYWFNLCPHWNSISICCVLGNLRINDFRYSAWILPDWLLSNHLISTATQEAKSLLWCRPGAWGKSHIPVWVSTSLPGTISVSLSDYRQFKVASLQASDRYFTVLVSHTFNCISTQIAKFMEPI